MRAMRNATLTLTLLSATQALTACFNSDEVLGLDCDETSETGAQALSDMPSEALSQPDWSPTPSEIPDGALWGPCRLDADGQELDGWGCDGAPGEWLACARPVHDVALSICLPQTWDEIVADDCTDLQPPGFGLGVSVIGSAYCAPRCVTDADCLAVQACAPASGICAWRE